MSAHCAEVGVSYQLLALALGAVLTLVSIRMIAQVSIDTDRWSYEDICDELFHPAMSIITGFVNVCNCLGAGAGYLIVCGQVFQVVTHASDGIRQLFVLLVGLIFCFPLALAPHVGFMRHLAALSVAALLLLVVTVVWCLGEYGVDDSITSETLWLGGGGATIFTYMNSANGIVFAYNNQFNVPQLTGELTPQPTTQKMTLVSLMTVALCFMLFGGISVVGVLAFGVGQNQQDSVVVDLAPKRSNPLVLVSLLGVMFSVLTCLQFHVFPIRQFAAYAVRKVRGRSVQDDRNDVKFAGRRLLRRWLDVICALVSIAVMILIALVVTSLKSILDFIGAFASSYISYVVPPLWVIQVLRRRTGFTWWSLEVLFSLGLFSLGLAFFVFGTYSAIIEASGA